MLKSLLSLGIIFLTACSPTESKKGAFYLPQPQVKSQFDGREFEFNDSRLGEEITLSAQDVLLMKHSPVGFELSIQSECIAPVANSEKGDIQRLPKHSLKRQDPRQVSFLEMLPPSALSLPESERNLVCKMQFVATSRDGSSHRFGWEQIKIQLQETPLLATDLQVTRFVSFANRGDQYIETEIEALYQLSCDRFQSEKVRSKVKMITLEHISASLGFSDFKDRNLLCRVLKLHEAGGVLQYSPSFWLTPDAPAVSISTAVSELELDTSSLELQLFRWELTHSENEPIFIDVSVGQTTLTLKDTLISQMGRNQTTQLVPAPMTVRPQIHGARKVVAVDGHTLRAEIYPNEKAFLVLHATRAKHCYTSNGLLFTNVSDFDLSLKVLRQIESDNSEDQLLLQTKLFLKESYWMPGPPAPDFNGNKSKSRHSPPPGGKIQEYSHCPRPGGIGW